MLFVEDVVAPGIVGATVELAVFPVPQDQIATAARTFATGHGSVAAPFVAIDIVEVLPPVGFRGGDDFENASAIESHLLCGQDLFPKSLDVGHDLIHFQDRLLSVHVQFGFIRKNNNPVDGNVVVKYQPTQ